MDTLVDLHLHTTASDGRLSPTELVHLVASQGLKQVAISDHDTTEGLAEAFEAAREFPDLRIIPAIEISTDIPGDEVHMLGYFLNHEDPELQSLLGRFRDGRLERGKAMVDKLATLGIHIDWKRVKEIAGDGAVGRPHIALAMVEKGYCKEPKDAFPEYLGRNGLAYVERTKMSPEQAVNLLVRFGAARCWPTLLIWQTWNPPLRCSRTPVLWAWRSTMPSTIPKRSTALPNWRRSTTLSHVGAATIMGWAIPGSCCQEPWDRHWKQWNDWRMRHVGCVSGWGASRQC